MKRSAPPRALRLSSRLHAAVLLLVAFACLALMPGTSMASCYISGASPVAFGSVSGGGATTSSDVQFTCVSDSFGNTITYRVCLYVDPNDPAGLDPRRMKRNDGMETLDYNLYAGPDMSQVIGSTTSGHAIYSTTLTLSPADASGRMPIYGSIPPQTTTAAYYVSRNTVFIRSPWLPGTTPPDPSACSTAANTGQSYLEATATFADTCYISTATDLDFGSVSDLAGNRDQASTISLRCPTNTSYQVALDYGANSGGGTTRRMLGPGGTTLAYELYRDPGRSDVWGNTSSGNVQDGTGSGSLQTLTVYGRVPAQPVAAAGTYSDTITVTLTF